MCSERIFIQESIYNKFRKDFVKEAKRLKIGNPLDPKTQQGAIVSKEHYNKVLGYFDKVRETGAKFITGGKPKTVNGSCSDGWFIEPSIIENLDRNTACYNQEAFGPVTSLHKFHEKDEVISMANETKKLVVQQQELMNTLSTMTPALNKAKETLENLNLPNMEQMTGILKKFT